MCEVCRLFSLVPALEVTTREYEVSKQLEICNFLLVCIIDGGKIGCIFGKVQRYLFTIIRDRKMYRIIIC